MPKFISSNKEVLASKGLSRNYFIIDLSISIILLLISSPILLLNLVLAKIQNKPFLKTIEAQDCLGRTIVLHRCASGFARGLVLPWSIILQNISFCGLPLRHSFNEWEKIKLQRFSHCSTGLFSNVDLHHRSGMSVVNAYDLTDQQLTSGRFAYLSLIVKGGFAEILFRRTKEQLKQPAQFKMFGLTIHNDSMQSAVSWITHASSSNEENRNCKIGYFINVNSVNIAANNRTLRDQINRADRCFADGSGMRLAARHIGLRINDNVNGTDLLPHLCEAVQQSQQSIYMLGAKPGVAAKAAQNLLEKYPNLNIAGTQDGYFGKENTQNVIAKINQSGANILLLAMGTPLQESWLDQYAPQLQCNSALAVGGLFDFYSGNIARAPMWMRELGLEWVWRLLQEPKNKFNRYVIGNPAFLIQTFIFNRAKRGF